MKKSGLTLGIFLLIIMTDIGESVAEILMKKGLIATGISSISMDNIREFIVMNASSYFIWAGVFIYILSFLAWIVILSRIELSVAFPIGSTSYIFVPILSIIFLHESVGVLRWVGILFIVAGIHFVSKSAKSRKKEPEKI
ncbi:MAG: EamA family transporter [Candidatus Omnitrophota bacterium]|jgi:drug/metabolite transporter (DMT)-like permease